ncbi:MAG: serine/threonine-protein kinase, partial [Chloroflexales bacterium]
MSQLNLIGTTLGRFEIISEIGRGGMAVVYKARQADLDRIVALKLLPPEMTHDTSYVARFRQEARSAARLEHPHIMPIYEVGETNGLHYIAMKFIQGRTLKELVQEDGSLSVRRAAEILAQVGDALDHAHRQGVIHRDIKPSNIMITDEGWVYLTDFGLARGTGGTAGTTTGGLTMAGTVMGTPEYMSPEQAQGLASVGPPTDIYALGVVLYELLTGTFPFKAETPMAMLAARLLQAPIPPRDVRGDLPPTVEDVVMRSLARKPEARFASSAEMAAALRAAAGIGAAPQAQPQLTPVGGTPAIGATIVAGSPPPTPSPYVRPQAPTPPPQAYIAPTQAAPQRGTP